MDLGQQILALQPIAEISICPAKARQDALKTLTDGPIMVALR
jgi:hypothetical protein